MSARWAFALTLIFIASVAFAHNPDTSYARIGITADHLDVRLTFDLFSLEKITGIDADHDQQVTREELQRAAPELQRFLQTHVHFEIDGAPAALDSAAPPEWPRDAGAALAAKDWHSAAALVAFPFRLLLKKPARDVTVTFDVFERLGAGYTILGAFECRGQREEVIFTQPEPDYLFDTTYVEGSELPRAEALLLANLRRFVRLGVEHIFLGYDHLCFLLALLVVSRFRELVKIVTSFTVAHSLTLILAALGVARLPSRLVECAIALTIVYVAAENLWRKNFAHRWLLTFAFGLIHGFGFAGVIAELGLPAVYRVRCLLAFNVGVEIGQLAIVALAFPCIVLLGKWRYGARVTAVFSILLGLFGLGWFFERAFHLGFMPV